MEGLFDVIVVGGGAIGMTSAWRLAGTGRRVLVLERGQLGAEASSAAAGMLGAQLELADPGPFYHLCLESRSLYPSFVNQLFDATGIDAQLSHNGIIQLAYSESDVRALEARLHWQTADGARAEWLDSGTVAAREPVLSGTMGGLLLPDDSNVNAPLLARALGVAVHRSCRVIEGIPATRIDSRRGGGYTVVTPSGEYAGETVVVAAGAWASSLLAEFDVPVMIAPVKGQLLSMRPRRGSGLRHTVFSNHVYLVPKRDGSVVVGATEDRNAGFNRDVTIDAMISLLSAVERIAPGLRDAVFERSWMGLRPGSSTGEPSIGELPDFPGLHVAIGHFRNGILLSPVTGEMIVRSVTGDSWPARWEPFRVAESHLLKRR